MGITHEHLLIQTSLPGWKNWSCPGDSHHKVAAEAPARAEATVEVEIHGAVI